MCGGSVLVTLGVGERRQVEVGTPDIESGLEGGKGLQGVLKMLASYLIVALLPLYAAKGALGQGHTPAKADIAAHRQSLTGMGIGDFQVAV